MPAQLIQGARLIDPIAGIDGRRDLLAVDGHVSQVAEQITRAEARRECGDASLTVMDAAGLWLLPGLVDVHVHLREPGYPQKETIATGTQAAAAGGFTTVVCEPNTDPPIDSVDIVRDVVARAEKEGRVHVYLKAAMTKGRRGEEPNDIASLAAEERVVALSDDGDPVVRPGVMAEVCRRAAEADILLSPHCADSPRALEQMADGVDPGFQPGEPGTNEARYIERDIEIAAEQGCRMHFSHVSLAESVEAIRRGRSRAWVTCEATPHHLLLCAEDFDPDQPPAVNPPIRSREDRDALRRALLAGQIEAIASDHAPHTAEDKAAGACGLIGLETTLGLVLTHLVGPGMLAPPDVVRLLSAAPARIFGLPAGSLEVGDAADMVLVDPENEWTVNPESFRSLSRNSPWAGRTLRGKAMATFVAGREAFADQAFSDRKDER
ncbi:MAG: dihydroorotase [Candidatus Brocadiia bacterium]